MRHGRLKMDTMMLNKYFEPSARIYTRLSVGYYEEMFGGAGGQMLYLPKQGNWATDLTVDWLKQRDTTGGFGFRNYTTITTLAAFHYRIPSNGLTFTLRGGRFLAKDEGVRFEIQRRFRSGVRVGAWYTVTNAKDITPPGSVDNPYHDKGIFLSVPLSAMLPKDTHAKAGFSLSPWTRDVGQMVHSPGDLYQIMEDPLLLDNGEQHLLSNFGR